MRWSPYINAGSKKSERNDYAKIDTRVQHFQISRHRANTYEYCVYVVAVDHSQVINILMNIDAVRDVDVLSPPTR